MRIKNLNHFLQRTLWVHLVVLIPVFTYSQKAETREVKTFSKVSVGNRIVGILVEDTVSKVILNPEGGAWTEEVRAKTDGKDLRIYSEGKYRESNIYCYIHYDQPIVMLDAEHGGIIRTDSNQVLETKKLEVNASIDGFTNLDVKVDELIISAGSGCDIYIRGFANKVKVYGTTGAKIHLDDLECNDAEATSIMGAKIWLSAKNNYTAKAGTGGKIYYYTEPAHFDRSRITGGDVQLITR